MVKYHPRAREAFDYLWMSPSQKRAYLLQRGISKKEFYESFRMPKFYRDELIVPDVMEILGICSRTFAKLNRKGFFGYVRDNPETIRGRVPRLVKSSRVEEISMQFAHLIPVSFFRELYKKQKFYFDKRSFNEAFLKYFEYPLGDNDPCVSWKNAARIIGRMKKRKAMNEEWHTLEDLSRDSGLNLSGYSLSRRYARIEREGKLRLRRINGVDKLCPYEYSRMLEIETRDAKELERIVDAHYIAQKLKIGDDATATMIRIGTELGFLHPDETFSLKDGTDRYFVPKHEAELWIKGRLNIPTLTRYSRLRRTLDVDEIAELLIRENEGVPISYIAAQMGKKSNSVAIMIAQGMQLGLLNPVSYRTHGSNRHWRFLLSADEASRLVSGEILIPSRARLRKLRTELGDHEIRQLLHRESRGISLEEIQRRIGYDINYIRQMIKVGERLGLLHPLNHKYSNGRVGRYFLSEEEARKLVDRELRIPVKKILGLGGVEEVSLGGSMGKLKQGNSGINGAELLERLKNGDSDAFLVFSALYAPVLESLKSQYRFKADGEDIDTFVQQSLFEVLIQLEPGSPSMYTPMLIEERLKQRIREDRPSWISLNVERNHKSGKAKRLIDIVDTERKLLI